MTQAPDQSTGQPNDRVRIFDTTLRDGEQSPGCSMNLSEKLRVADALARLRVDIIEAGFPIASPGDFESVTEIAKRFADPAGEDGHVPVICGLARCQDRDIDRAWEAVQHAAKPRIHVFLATSAIHREHKLGMAKDEIVRRSVEGVRRARALCDDVEFSPEDAARTEPDFLAEVVRAAIEAGATTINIPDTVGYTTPNEFEECFKSIREKVPGADKIVLSVHCHDDLGMAVANSLAAVRGGARQVECTINGIGERAGNAALEEVVMALRTRADVFGVDTGVNARQLTHASKLVAAVTGSVVQANKAIVGRNAFAHEAGIHQHGVLQHASTYEIIRGEDVGYTSDGLVLGKHSGKHAIRSRLESLTGEAIDDDRLAAFVERFKALADRKKDIFDADLLALLAGSGGDEGGPWALVSIKPVGGMELPIAGVRMRRVDRGPSDDAGNETGEVHEIASTGDGAVDATFNAMMKLTGVDLTLTSYVVQGVTPGTDAQGRATIEATCDGRVYRGQGVSTDVIRASAEALLEIINQVLTIRAHGDGGPNARVHPQYANRGV